MFRAWFYFRNGYGTYLSFPIGFFTFISTTYYLAVQNVPFLSRVFSHFYIYAIIAITLIIPFGILLGWLHMKRTLAYPAQVAIDVESNPYNYKITPGISTEIGWPMNHLILRTLEKMSKEEGVLSPEEMEEFRDLTAKIEKLRKGEIIGVPRQRRLLSP